jgi:hypothetical protein
MIMMMMLIIIIIIIINSSVLYTYKLLDDSYVYLTVQNLQNSEQHKYETFSPLQLNVNIVDYVPGFTFYRIW